MAGRERKDVVGRVRRRRVMGASAAAITAAAIVIPLSLGRAAGSVNTDARRAVTGTSLGQGPGAAKEAPVIGSAVVGFHPLGKSQSRCESQSSPLDRHGDSLYP